MLNTRFNHETIRQDVHIIEAYLDDKEPVLETGS